MTNASAMTRYLISFVLLTLLLLTACRNGNETKEGEDVSPSEITITDAMLGQLIMQGFRGLKLDSISPVVREQIAAGEIGNVILFDYDLGYKSYERNVSDPDQVKTLLADLQKLAPGYLLTAVDQEGGRVVRLKPRYGFPMLPTPQELGVRETTDSTTHYAQANAATLQELGFNVNFAPVVDLNLHPENPIIGKLGRSFGAETDRVVRHARAWIGPHAERGIVSVLKHFPGHGSSDQDSHEGFVDVTDRWQPEEFEPYRQLLGTETDVAVMTAHVFHRGIDSLYPATLSPHYIQAMLRDSLHYEGVVFSDDLQMKAVNKMYDFETIVRQSILAGVDVLVIGNNQEYDETLARRTIATLHGLLRRGEISRERILESYDRVTALKTKLQAADKTKEQHENKKRFWFSQ